MPEPRRQRVRLLERDSTEQPKPLWGQAQRGAGGGQSRDHRAAAVANRCRYGG
jgi:hypothetical protein